MVSLFTNIPLQENIDLAVDLIFEYKKDLRIDKEELEELSNEIAKLEGKNSGLKSE